jgi:hypothetical protein
MRAWGVNNCHCNISHVMKMNVTENTCAIWYTYHILTSNVTRDVKVMMYIQILLRTLVAKW